MEAKTVYFETLTDSNTDETLLIARRRAQELGIKTILVASTKGPTGVKAVKILKGFRVIIVSHSHGFHEQNVQELTEENRKIIENNGGIILTATHVFAGVSRATKIYLKDLSIGDLIASVLRVFGHGVKVGCEIAMMAADAGLVRTDEEVISIGGTKWGADTALVLTPVTSQNFFDMRVKEILCKPRLESGENYMPKPAD